MATIAQRYPSLMDWKAYLIPAALLWCLLWAGINSGPWVFYHQPTSLRGWGHYARTAFPLFVMLAALMMVAQGAGRGLQGPARYWLIYGLVSVVGCVMSPLPLDALYWAASYISVILAAVAYLQGGNLLTRAKQLNMLTWGITIAFLLVLLFVAREALIVETARGLTGRGITGRIETVAGAAMPRETGMARFAAVPGVLAMMLLFKGQGVMRIFAAAAGAGCLAMIYLMQSRGATFAYVGAVVFVLYFLAPKLKRFAVAILVIAFPLLVVGAVPEEYIERVTHQVTRGASFEELSEMTGRNELWRRARPEIMKSAVIGWGPQADRLLIGQHVHNTYMYALLSAGVLGAVAFTVGLAAAWLMFFRAINHPLVERHREKTFLVAIGGILAFFTVRGIPEVSGAMFGVDLMIMVPALVYLGILNRQLATSPRPPRRVKRPVRQPRPAPQSIVSAVGPETEPAGVGTESQPTAVGSESQPTKMRGSGRRPNLRR